MTWNDKTIIAETRWVSFSDDVLAVVDVAVLKIPVDWSEQAPSNQQSKQPTSKHLQPHLGAAKFKWANHELYIFPRLRLAASMYCALSASPWNQWRHRYKWMKKRVHWRANSELLSWFGWLRFVNALVYYGVFLSAPSVGGNLYLNFFLASLVELPAIPIGVWIYNRWENQKMHKAFDVRTHKSIIFILNHLGILLHICSFTLQINCLV